MNTARNRSAKSAPGFRGDPGVPPDQPEVRAQSRVLSRVGYLSAAVVFFGFIAIALVMRQDNAGAHFVEADQVGTGVVGLMLAGMCLMPTRPRMRADAQAVRLRSFLGAWRVVPWDVVVRVEFPRRVQFARLVLPGDEVLVIYAIARVDKQRAVAAMRQLRALANAVDAARPVQ
jgi:hypothetical protein